MSDMAVLGVSLQGGGCLGEVRENSLVRHWIQRVLCSNLPSSFSYIQTPPRGLFSPPYLPVLPVNPHPSFLCDGSTGPAHESPAQNRIQLDPTPVLRFGGAMPMLKAQPGRGETHKALRECFCRNQTFRSRFSLSTLLRQGLS